MTRKPKYTRKDDNLIILGLSMALMFQVFYDMLHEIYFKDINMGWLAIQGGIIVIFVLVGIMILRSMDTYSRPF